MSARRTKVAALRLPPTPLEQRIAAIEADDKECERKPHKRRSNAICILCSTPFYATPRQLATGGGRYCSNACKGDAYRGKNSRNWVERPPITCEQCGKLFNRPPSHEERSQPKYCSKTCFDQAQREAREKRRCLACGEILTRNQQKYCSMSCYVSMNSGANSSQYRNAKVEKHCEVCGTTFQAKRVEVTKGFGRFCSMKCLGVHRAQNGSGYYSRTRGGRRTDLDNRYFRSGWEANYARYLNWLISVGQIAKWEYEVDTYEFTAIKRGVRTYTPDFKIHNLDGSTEYHEVKGWMDAKSKTKLDRMRRYYPAIKVIIIDEPAYKAIAKEVKHLVAGWELSPKHSA